MSTFRSAYTHLRAIPSIEKKQAASFWLVLGLASFAAVYLVLTASSAYAAACQQEIGELRRENEELKQLVGELPLQVSRLKKTAIPTEFWFCVGAYP